MFKRLLYAFALSLLSFYMQAQENMDWGTQVASAAFLAKKVVPPAPEAAALGKYGNVPVSLFTGTPNISIPLYQLSGNNINLPIQLNYNASGFNPQEIATWVGLSWSLNAGGVVTRSVQGNPDVSSNYFKTPSPLVVPNQGTDPFGYDDYMKNLRKGINEAQPDVYYYNFAGNSGKFYVKPDNSIFKKDKNNYLITAVINSIASGSFIRITDDKGIRYEFMEAEVSDMTSDDAGTGGILSHTYASSWYLTRIISADGLEEINLTYYTTPLKHTQYNIAFQDESDTYEYTVNSAGTGNLVQSSQGGSAAAPLVKTTRKYLSQISFKRGGQLLTYIDFISTVDQRQDLNHNTADGFPGERLLTSVMVYVKNTPTAFALNKQYNFNYTYFINGTQNFWLNKRLRLDNVQEVPVIIGTATPPPYRFTYNDDNAMPGIGTAEMDHWGFYNKGTSSARLVPDVLITNNQLTVTAYNREPSLAGSSTYLMNKITYPLGGYTTFEYELNTAWVSGTVLDVGGVRIKKITDYSFTSKKAVEKNYRYLLPDGSTSGRAMLPGYTNASNFTTYGGGSMCATGFLSKTYTTTVSANSIFGLGKVQGSHIGYSTVTEFLSDPLNGQALGKTVYDYYCQDGYWNPHNDDAANGDLLKKSVYDNGGNLMEETVNQYNYIPQGSLGAVSPGVSAAQDNKNVLVKRDAGGGIFVYVWFMSAACEPAALDSRIIKTKYYNGGWVATAYEKQLQQTTFKKWHPTAANYITVIKKFTYGNTAHVLPTSIEQTTSGGEVIVTDKKYTLDYVVPGTGTLDQNTQGIKLLQTKNITTVEIESVQRRQNADGTNKRYINGTLTCYNTAIPYPLSLYRLETSTPPTIMALSSISAGSLIYNSAYKLSGSFNFLSNGALLEQSKNLDVPTAYIWHYDYRHPAAEIVNGNTGKVAYTSFETDENGGWSTIAGLSANRVTSTAFTGKYSYNLISGNSITFTSLQTTRQFVVSYWSNNGAVTITPNTGTAVLTTGTSDRGWTYYEHLLPAGASSVTISAAVTRNIDELRLHPKDALMTTYTYEPGVGILSQCSPTGETRHFSYDGLGRLLFIKDREAAILESYTYNFGTDMSQVAGSAQTLFYNDPQQGSYTKTGCPVGTEPTTEIYKVPYGRYASAVNTAAANTQSTTDVTNNGQAYAQSVGKCLYWNTQQSSLFAKNDCLPSEGVSVCSTTGPVVKRGQVAYIVTAHTYSSELSQSDADQKALDHITANGQNYANTYCWCACTDVGYKMVNGSCELGTRYNSSTSQQANGTWICNFYYEFSDTSIIEYSEVNATPCPIQ